MPRTRRRESSQARDQIDLIVLDLDRIGIDSHAHKPRDPVGNSLHRSGSSFCLPAINGFAVAGMHRGVVAHERGNVLAMDLFKLGTCSESPRDGIRRDRMPEQSEPTHKVCCLIDEEILVEEHVRAHPGGGKIGEKPTLARVGRATFG